ncbi:RICIN domain-containing protein, partial [Streptomyces longispororuber]|uniref:RICIN domain-containing protein n=1 Tax=Streptomyces longispororuber TaxID=68230 RepID=UPI00167C8E69
MHSGKCVAVDGSSQLPGAPVVQAECSGQPGALWTLRQSASDGGAVNIVNPHSGRCVEIAEVSGVPRARQAECGGQKEADFHFEDRETFAWIKPQAAASSRCLEVPRGSHAHGAPLGLADCLGQPGSAFRQRQPREGNDPATAPEAPLVTPADIDSDGKGDLVVLRADGVVSVHRNVGDHFDSGAPWSKGWGNFLGLPGQGRLHFADINGDTKADLIVHDTDGNISVRTNKNTHFDSGTPWSKGWHNYLGQPGQGRLHFADINGDTKADLIVHDTDGNISR